MSWKEIKEDALVGGMGCSALGCAWLICLSPIILVLGFAVWAIIRFTS